MNPNTVAGVCFLGIWCLGCVGIWCYFASLTPVKRLRVVRQMVRARVNERQAGASEKCKGEGVKGQAPLARAVVLGGAVHG